MLINNINLDFANPKFLFVLFRNQIHQENYRKSKSWRPACFILFTDQQEQQAK